MGRRVEEKCASPFCTFPSEVTCGQRWKSKYADVTYVVYGGGTLGRVEMYDTTNHWDCKQVYKEELREHFILIKDTSIILSDRWEGL